MNNDISEAQPCCAKKVTDNFPNNGKILEPGQFQDDDSSEIKYYNKELTEKFIVSTVKYKNAEDIQESRYAEVLFKSQRKYLFLNKNNLKLRDSEYVVVEVENGRDLGAITASGKQASEKFKAIYKSEEPRLTIVRHANTEDIEKFKNNRVEELEVIEKTKVLVEQYQLDMKITDAEWQFDRQRLTIFFTAPQRIDFRELVKDLARTFKTRIELRQISTREEAKRIGGIGPCGRRLCCTCLADEFCHVTLDHARTQQLSNNVAKLSGYCGRLKCCLLYEYDTYVEAFKKYPPLDYRIEMPEGIADIVKVDIFKELLYLHIRSAGAYKSITYEELEVLAQDKKIFPPDETAQHEAAMRERKAQELEKKKQQSAAAQKAKAVQNGNEPRKHPNKNKNNKDNNRPSNQNKPKKKNGGPKKHNKQNQRNAQNSDNKRRDNNNQKNAPQNRPQKNKGQHNKGPDKKNQENKKSE